MDSMSTLISSIKVILISAGALFLVLAVKFSVPVVWSVILSGMKPPYLYIVVNGIIITIAATSRFYRIESGSDPTTLSEHLVSVKTPTPADFALLAAQTEVRNVVEEPQTAEAAAIVVYEGGDRIVELRPVLVNGAEVGVETAEETEAVAEAEAESEAEDLAYSSLTQEKFPSELQLEYLLPVREKPLVSSRLETTPEEGISLATAEQGTLESTWKMITEGRHAPLTEHPMTPDTLGRHVQKSQTFKDRTSHRESPAPGPTSSRLWKETSPSQDELNRRVEAFIKKINNEMRLQREESLKQHMEKINGGI